MASPNPGESLSVGVVIATSLVTFVSGMLFGVYAVRGHILSPALVEERRKTYADPVESDESDVDEAAGPLDHAPNWVNREEADRRDGLRASRGPRNGTLIAPSPAVAEECKLVLVVRTDLAMGKGESCRYPVPPKGCAPFLDLDLSGASSLRQNRCTMQPRDARLLQGPFETSPGEPLIVGGIVVARLGAWWSSKDCRSSQERG